MIRCRTHQRLARLAGMLAVLALCMGLVACTITIPNPPSLSQSTSSPTSATPSTSPSGTQAAQVTGTVSPTANSRQASVVAVSSSAVTVASNSTGQASASCANGQPMLGGGFISRFTTGGGNDGTPPVDSYPSSGGTWSVSVETLASSVQLTAVAACLQANFSVSTQVAQASNGGPDTTIACPASSVLTGGGFRSGGGTNVASQPNGNGWKVSTGIPFGGSATPTAYAVCASSGLKAATTQSQSKTVTNGTITSNGATCPSGQLPVGGGYNGYQPAANTFWRVFLNTPETGQGTTSTGWMAQVHNGQFGTPAFTVYSVCATF